MYTCKYNPDPPADSAISRVTRLLALPSSSPATLEFATLALAHAAMLLDGARKV